MTDTVALVPLGSPLPQRAVVRANQSAAECGMEPAEDWGGAPGVGPAWRGFNKRWGAALSQSGGFDRDDRSTDPDVYSAKLTYKVA